MERKDKKVLNWKCKECKTRFSIDELDELGYVEKFGESLIIECKECGYQELRK